MRKSLSDCLVRAEGLVKHFGRVRALDGLDLQVAPAEVHGFLGPNGAGKSTTVRALLGQIRTDGGHLEVFGLPAWERAVDIHSRLAYVPADTTLWPGLSGGECVDLLGGFHGGQDRRLREELIERFELDPTRKVRTYSKGNRQKVALVAALSTRCELLVLDEPTSGLDPLMELVFQQVVAERAEQGCSVLLSSHVLAEVEALCGRVTIIRDGRSVSTGSLEDLRAGSLTSMECVTPQAPAGLARLAGVTSLRQSAHPHGVLTTLLVSPDGLAQVASTVGAAQPTRLTVSPPSLEQLFLGHYQDASAPTSGLAPAGTAKHETAAGGQPRGGR